MDNNIREEQISFLQKIKPLILSPFLSSIKTDKHKIQNTTQETNFIEVNELIQRLEKVEKMLELRQEEGVRKSRIKEQIISLLQQNKKLTSSQLSKLIGLSRTRCSEYFRELTREGKTEGVIINRQKYYKLVGK